MSSKEEAEDLVDVIIIGAGFAGVTVARELSQRGKRVVILEARDRIGGRTLTENTDFDCAEPLELGGAWVHWLQPHVWSELTRYGLDLNVCDDVQRVMWFAGNQLHSGRPEEFEALIGPSMDIFVRDALSLFPIPDRPINVITNALREADQLSIKDKIEQMHDTPDVVKELLDGFWSINFNCPSNQGAYTQAMRWIARAGGSWQFALQSCGQYTIKKGTIGLLKCMLDDSIPHTTVHLNTIVTNVNQTGKYASVRLSNGKELHAKYVVVTVPLNVLNRITFSPPLNDRKQQAASTGQASCGIKLFIHVRGVPSESFCAYASSDYAINYVQTERCSSLNDKITSDTSILLAFGPDATRINVTDRTAVAKELQRWLPDVEVLQVVCYDWFHDLFSGETWPMLRPGQLTACLSALQEPEKRIRLAGSDYASFYAGSIDGAIESGLRAARTILNELESCVPL
ncbi:unnamed protein product [Rotaria magnacalcarata]|uniref:Amine oxidase n=1 Tax=Rotaria magnacalcarata TaxID=392030 RepID=A0A816TTV8_9BILA|nr:unnamed protein product [Rotaria magnacalcarata]CAF2105464.1 unnamed protein product [Rotaria magnacalcarata]CAF4043462.1 unnamed protein product [Rotaria magnacalcarata]CAF4090319.1 unnamed protein product [Rotaria magnacalcarata]